MKKNKDPLFLRIPAFIGGFCFLIVLFFTAFQCVVYCKPFAHAEMEKYEVAAKVGMEKEDVNDLFDTMLMYLDDSIQNFDVKVSIGGVEQRAFSDKEILHMVDVKGLFQAGFLIRNVCLVLFLVCFVILILFGRKTDRSGNGSKNRKIKRIISGGFLKASVFFVLLIGLLGGAVMLDFDRAFIRFHEIFFNNDFWLLDYDTDLLINLVPELYSMDVARYFVLLFAVLFALFLIIAIIVYGKNREGKNPMR